MSARLLQVLCVALWLVIPVAASGLDRQTLQELASVGGCGGGDDCIVGENCGCWEQCVVTTCAGCGDTGEPICIPGPACMPWHNATGICSECGDSGQVICLSGSQCKPWRQNILGFCAGCGTEGQVPCTQNSDVCQDGLVPAGPAGGLCRACGDAPGLACLDDPTPCAASGAPNDAILDFCLPCGGSGQPTCEYAGVPRCDAGLQVFDLDPIRHLLTDFYDDLVPVPQSLLDLLGLSIDDVTDTVDYCFDVNPDDFQRDAPVIWPGLQAPTGPRTLVRIHGQKGGGFDLDADEVFPGDEEALFRFGSRNLTVYQVDYNAAGNRDANGNFYPMRVFAIDENGEAYVAYQGPTPINGTNFIIRDVADFVRDALVRVPIRGKLILQSYSMGGFTARELVYRHYDELRFRGADIDQVLFAGHPHFGQVVAPQDAIALTCSPIYGFDMSGMEPSDPLINQQNCVLNRWLEGWDNTQSLSIDNDDRPQIRWNNVYGTGGGQRPIPFAEEVTGTDVSSLPGDGTVDAQSARGFDAYNSFRLDQLAFDTNTDCTTCDDHSAGNLLAAMLAENPGVYSDAVVCGDLAVDAAVDAADAEALQQHLAGNAPLSQQQLTRCDVSGDGGCDILDAVVLARTTASPPRPPGLLQTCPAAFDLTDKLAVYWPMDEGSGVSVANAAPSCSTFFDGSLQGGTNFGAGLAGAGGLSFSPTGGEDYVQLAHPRALAALEVHRRLSVSLWVRPASLSANGYVFVNKEGEFELGVSPAFNLNWALTAAGAAAMTQVETAFALPIGVWTHVAMVYDGDAGTVVIYANGVPVQSHEFAGELADLAPNQNELRLGRRTSGFPQAYDGEMDELAVWHRVLRPDEVAALYNGGAGLSLDPVGNGLGLCADPLTPQVNVYFSQAEFDAAVGVQDILLTTPSNVELANEVSPGQILNSPGAPGSRNVGLGPTLTFDAANTGLCRSFQARTGQSGAGFTFEDNEMAGNPLDSLSVGDVDNYENDNFYISHVSGPPLKALGFILFDNIYRPAEEGIRVFDVAGNLIHSTNVLPDGASFIGIVSNVALGEIFVNEDNSGDDIGIRHFYFDRTLTDSDLNGIADCDE